MWIKEDKRLKETKCHKKHWRRWGPYLSARQWGTVREDYSENGDAWDYLGFENSHSCAYRWGEDGIAGISDNHQRVCFGFSFWNEQDYLLKEKLFGLTGKQGNHGEDVKEYFFHLDNTPTHSYMKFLYKYPQSAFPYQKLIEENAKRTHLEEEFELLDTKIFDDGNYYDIFIEYAKKDYEDLLIKCEICNRSNKTQKIHVLPTIWLRNTWVWFSKTPDSYISQNDNHLVIFHPDLKERYLYFQEKAEPIFTDNETNFQKISKTENKSPYTKDAFHRYVIHKDKAAVKTEKKGTKAAIYHQIEVPANSSKTIYLRFTDQKKLSRPFSSAEKIFAKRKKEADKFFKNIAPKKLNQELLDIQRQAFASLLWTKQFYHYVVEEWLDGDYINHTSDHRKKTIRNNNWKHVYIDDILAVPDKWEYPWFASWDTGFHCITYSLIDTEFAKKQIRRLTREWYMHPNGHIPSYEWDFNDANPPVLAWSAWRIYKIDEKKNKKPDTEFLNSVYQKLLLSFTWWVNRKDQDGKNIFQGGFLGLDNISIFNRSEKLPEGGTLNQSDATSWMGMFCLNMWTISVELAKIDHSYEDMASKFFEHFLYIADAINYQKKERLPLWCEEDGFYYDLIQYTDGRHQSLKVRSMVGLIPLFAIATIENDHLNQIKGFKKRYDWFLHNRHDLCHEIACMREHGVNDRHILSIINKERLIRILDKMLDENEFLSDYGIRSISKFHEKNPYKFDCNGKTMSIGYEPAESQSALFGGNSNWRGPIWFPLNFLIIESLQKFHHFYGDNLKVECPKGSGKYLTLWEVSGEISRRLISIFQKDQNQNRPVYYHTKKFQEDPYFNKNILFFEYFNGDTGKGIGASHQTGWTALIAKLIQQRGEYFLD
jgi:Mannosylglycerate hydrolase MGH1-like glycoside hydrolase domain/Glycosyl hydrolase family 63 C-terminal domain